MPRSWPLDMMRLRWVPQMNDCHRNLPPHDQPGYWQFYSNGVEHPAAQRRQLSAGNRLIALGVGGVMLIGAILVTLVVLR